MEYYNDPYEDCPIDENWEFNSAINSLITREVDNRTELIKNDYENLQTTNKKLYSEIHKIKTELEAEQNKNNLANTKEEFLSDIINLLNKDNVKSLIKLAYKPDFNESGQFEYPVWFELIVNYYSIKDKIIKLLRTCDIKVPDKAEKLRLPFDWTKEELDVFFNTMYNHYVCNGQAYSDNLNFWSSAAWDNPIENCKTNYSEIPWQFVLRHPLLNTKEYCLKMAEQINKGGNGRYFCKVLSYQKLDKKHLSVLVNDINMKEKLKDDDIKTLILNNLDLIKDKEKLDRIYKYVENVWKPEQHLKKMPKEYFIKYAKSKGKESRNIICETDILTQEEKLELLKEII